MSEIKNINEIYVKKSTIDVYTYSEYFSDVEVDKRKRIDLFGRTFEN